MNPSINALKASDGSGNASVATVSNTRAPLATTIQVDTVQGINDDFFGTMGTPHTFTDPVTGETITVISEATAVDFRGHVDGSNLEIDEIAPGYTDAGSSVGDIVIIRPTTQWGDQVAEVLEVSHNDNGTIKNDSISDQQMFTDPLDPVLRASEIMFDHVASGLVWTADAAGSTRAASMTAGVVYINGKRITVAAVAARLFTASKDTYVDVLDTGNGTGTLVYTETTNSNGTSPALAANSVRIAVIVTGASSIAAAASINQGQNNRLLPTASATEYMQITDTLGNLIYPRDPQRRTIGYREVANSDRSTTSATPVDVTGLKTTVKTVADRKVKFSFGCRWVQFSISGNGFNMSVEEDGVQIYEKVLTSQGVSHAQNMDFTFEFTPTAGTHTYNLRFYGAGGGTFLVKCTGATGAKAWIAIEQA